MFQTRHTVLVSVKPLQAGFKPCKRPLVRPSLPRAGDKSLVFAPDGEDNLSSRPSQPWRRVVGQPGEEARSVLSAQRPRLRLVCVVGELLCQVLVPVDASQAEGIRANLISQSAARIRRSGSASSTHQELVLGPARTDDAKVALVFGVVVDGVGRVRPVLGEVEDGVDQVRGQPLTAGEHDARHHHVDGRRVVAAVAVAGRLVGECRLGVGLGVGQVEGP